MSQTFQNFSFNGQLQSVRVVATGNVSGTYFNGPINNGVGATFTIASSSLTIDSVTLVVGDPFLLMAQSSGNQNGIYVVNSIGSTVICQRRDDLQCAEQAVTGNYVYVKAGTVNAGACFVIVEPAPATFGISNLIFSASPLNSGLGTAAAKAASNNSDANLASITGATVVNQIPVNLDTAGTIGSSTGISATLGGSLQTAGNILAGNATGTSGEVVSYPGTTTTGSLALQAVASAGAYNTVISNRSMGQSTTFSIGDPGQSTASILTSKVNADVGANLITFDITCGEAALASGGSVTLYASSGSKQYKIRHLQINSGGTNFSGGSGDRLGQVTDGTTVYSVIPAANLQTLANAQWGATALPNPASAAINTSTAAGASLVFKYSGGTTDYTAGSIVVTGMLERVA